MKRILAIILTFTALYNSAGYYVLFQLQLGQLKSRVAGTRSGQLPKGMVLMKEKHGSGTFDFVEADEFTYEGELYDVLRQEEVGGETWYYCLKDSDEDQLLTGLSEQVQQNGDTQSKNTKQLQNLLVKDFAAPPAELVFFAACTENTLFSFYNFHCTDPVREFIIPPPQLT